MGPAPFCFGAGRGQFGKNEFLFPFLAMFLERHCENKLDIESLYIV